MRITEAASRLGTSPRMLRYREELGLLPPLRDVFRWRSGGRLSGGAGRLGPAHRQFSETDIAAVAAELDLEKRYDISPAALAFGLRILAEPSVRASVADLARRLGRLAPAPSRALDFEKERALRSISRN
ncbi:MAG TPA: MerR family DNA-binding transcriptional regulator [Streptosporangiaceae bacterium]